MSSKCTFIIFHGIDKGGTVVSGSRWYYYYDVVLRLRTEQRMYPWIVVTDIYFALNDVAVFIILATVVKMNISLILREKFFWVK